jgi:hypothetical protein
MSIDREITTIEIYQKDAATWKRWKKAAGLNSPELMERIMVECALKHQQEMYRKLPRPVVTAKPLAGKKIKKNHGKKASC